MEYVERICGGNKTNFWRKKIGEKVFCGKYYQKHVEKIQFKFWKSKTENAVKQQKK